MPATAKLPQSPLAATAWSHSIPSQQWLVYARVIDEAQCRAIPFALGGAFALAAHTGRLRNTKDLDIYVLPRYRKPMIELVTALGLRDYYNRIPYDRWWIYRSHTGDTIVDVIWAMANRRARVDELWISGPEIELCGRSIRVLPAEAILWDKLYILQRDRCDWPDVMNLLFCAAGRIDWEYLIGRIGEDLPLLSGALSVFRWLAPRRAQALPAWVWDRLQLPAVAAGPLPDIDQRRAALLDRRHWFGPEPRKRKTV
jgi:hypothetical protein